MSTKGTLFEFQKQFGSEADCIEHLEKTRWPAGFRCPNCTHDVGYRINFRRLIQCAVCRHQTSVTAGTIFHKTRIPLQLWFWIIYLLVEDKGGTPTLNIAKDLGMHYSTVWHLVHKIRYAMSKRDESIKLAGFLELDEAIIGPPARKPGRPTTRDGGPGPRKKHIGQRKAKAAGKTQVEVIIIVERESAHAGNVIMKVVENATAGKRTTRDDIEDLVNERVEPYQWFKTDGCQSHAVLKSLGHKLDMKAMSGPESCEELPIVHRVISLVKRWLLGRFHGVSQRYLQYYLYEFCFRFNRRDNKHPIYSSLLTACALAVPIQYAEVLR
jgi:hypothetical protein